MCKRVILTKSNSTSICLKKNKIIIKTGEILVEESILS